MATLCDSSDKIDTLKFEHTYNLIYINFSLSQFIIEFQCKIKYYINKIHTHTYAQWHIVRIARLQLTMKLDLCVRCILIASVHNVVLGVVLQRCHISVCRSVAILMEQNKTTLKLIKAHILLHIKYRKQIESHWICKWHWFNFNFNLTPFKLCKHLWSAYVGDIYVNMRSILKQKKNVGIRYLLNILCGHIEYSSELQSKQNVTFPGFGDSRQ